MNTNRPSLLITSVGWLNVLIGLVFVGFGVYVLVAGADAVTALLQIPERVGDAVDIVASKKRADQVEEAVGVFAKGLGGIIVAFALVIAGCSFLQGLPNLLVGVGVIVRSNAARIFALIFAVLALLEGLACIAGALQTNRLLYLGLFLLFYAIVTFVALIGKRASFEFSGGLNRPPESTAEASMGETMATASSSNPLGTIVLALLLVAATAAASVFATLYFTSQATTPLAQHPDGKRDPKAPPPAIDDTTALAMHKPKLAAFHEAVLAGQIPRAAEMLKDVDVDEPDDHGRTALMKAFATGNLRATLFLIALGAHVNQADRDGKTPIMHAAENNQASIVDLFDSNQQAQAEMAALRVKYSGSHQGDGLGAIKGTVIKFEMPKLNLRLTDKRGQTAAVIAILKGHLGVANTLSRPGWDGRPDAFDDGQGNSVLHLAAATGNVRVIRHFRRFNVDYWAYYLSLSDPLNSYAWLCCRHGAINEEGKEPWMIAAEKGHLEVTKHLLPAPSLEDLTRKDKAGKTGLDLAAANHHKEVVAYLRQIQGDLKKKAEPPDKK